MAEPYVVEYVELSRTIALARAALRVNNRCEPMQWVLNPDQYAFMQAHMDAGCTDDYHQAFWSQCVRDELWEPDD